MDYKSALRELRRTEGDLSARLRSIHRDSLWLADTLDALPSDASDTPYPVYANLRCGLWYLPPERFSGTCHFKSTDGHYGTWNFSLRRLNVNLLRGLESRECAVVVDSTRKGKHFPDALNRTIPIWAAVVNRVKGVVPRDAPLQKEEFPFAISGSELSQIRAKIPGFVAEAEGCGVLWEELPLTKPIQCVQAGWRTDMARLLCSVDFDASRIALLVSASDPTESIPRLPYTYVQGAGDDQESWARGLLPSTFWANAEELTTLPPIECISRAAELSGGAGCGVGGGAAGGTEHLPCSMAGDIGAAPVPPPPAGGVAGAGLAVGVVLPEALSLWRGGGGGVPTGTLLSIARNRDVLDAASRVWCAGGGEGVGPPAVICAELSQLPEVKEALLRLQEGRGGATPPSRFATAFDGALEVFPPPEGAEGEEEEGTDTPFGSVRCLVAVVREGSKKDLEKAIPFVFRFAEAHRGEEGGGGGAVMTVACPSGCGASVAVAVALLMRFGGVCGGEGSEGAPSKQALRNVLAQVSTYVAAAAPSRNLMKQLNRFFIGSGED